MYAIIVEETGKTLVNIKRGKNENEKCECATARYGGTPFDFIVENKTKRKIDPFFFVVVFFYSFVTLVVC